MRLGIDLDGVVADFNGGWIRLYNEEFGAAVASDAVTNWDDLHQHTHFSSMTEFWRWARGGPARSTIWRHLDPYSGAVATLDDLSRDHDVVIITTKPRWAIHDTFAWIADNLIPTREVHITRRKWAVPADVYLDDSPFQLPKLLTERPDAVICRFARPWNEPLEGAVDVTDWHDFARLVETESTARGPTGGAF